MQSFKKHISSKKQHGELLPRYFCVCLQLVWYTHSVWGVHELQRYVSVGGSSMFLVLCTCLSTVSVSKNCFGWCNFWSMLSHFLVFWRSHYFALHLLPCIPRFLLPRPFSCLVLWLVAFFAMLVPCDGLPSVCVFAFCRLHVCLPIADVCTHICWCLFLLVDDVPQE